MRSTMRRSPPEKVRWMTRRDTTKTHYSTFRKREVKSLRQDPVEVEYEVKSVPTTASMAARQTYRGCLLNAPQQGSPKRVPGVPYFPSRSRPVRAHLARTSRQAQVETRPRKHTRNARQARTCGRSPLPRHQNPSRRGRLTAYKQNCCAASSSGRLRPQHGRQPPLQCPGAPGHT